MCLCLSEREMQRLMSNPILVKKIESNYYIFVKEEGGGGEGEERESFGESIKRTELIANYLETTRQTFHKGYVLGSTPRQNLTKQPLPFTLCFAALAFNLITSCKTKHSISLSLSKLARNS